MRQQNFRFETRGGNISSYITRSYLLNECFMTEQQTQKRNCHDDAGSSDNTPRSRQPQQDAFFV
eukprot:m.69656 g.69656  ORF g.69656 m.69656 type:complete len:64 (+) comp13746_c0_seq2:549-740(+)